MDLQVSHDYRVVDRGELSQTARPSSRPDLAHVLEKPSGWACDFLQTYDVWFRPIFAFFVIDINTNRVVHVGVTRSPAAEWTAQQLRNITPFGEGPQFIIRDNDNKFGAEFDQIPVPSPRKLHRKGTMVISTPVLGGLHHDYQVAA